MKFKTVEDKFVMAKWDGVQVIGVIRCLNEDGEGPFTFSFINQRGGQSIQLFMNLTGTDRITNIEVLT